MGYNLAALTVDTRPEPKFSFPIIRDPEREMVKAWDLFNSRERGGIADPASVVLGPDGAIRWIAREGVARRIRPDDLLAHLRSATDASVPPPARAVWPRLRDLGHALVSQSNKSPRK